MKVSSLVPVEHVLGREGALQAQQAQQVGRWGPGKACGQVQKAGRGKTFQSRVLNAMPCIATEARQPG